MLTHQLSSPVPPRRVVVLGSRGFVGANLVSCLQAQSIDVLGLSSRDVDLTAIESVTALRSAIRPDDALVFVSALTPDKGRDIATMMRNLQMGQHVCAALSQTRCGHVTYLSSDAVYEDDANPVRETSCASPTSYHGTMHLVRERMLIETLRAATIPLAIVRPSLIYGPGDTHNGYGPNRFVRTAATDRKIALFGGGEEKRDHVYIDDLSRIIDLVLRHRSCGVLNVATGRSTSFADIAVLVRGLVGEDVQVIPSPRANPITHRHFDITALAQAFPTVSLLRLDEGLGHSMSVARAGDDNSPTTSVARGGER
jgi:UDP-glucose 4-epimerase